MTCGKNSIRTYRLRKGQLRGRGLHSFTSQLNLSRFVRFQLNLSCF